MRQLLRKRCVPIRVWAVRGRRDALRFITRVTFTAAVDPLWHPDSCFFPLVRHQRSRRARTGWRLRPSDSSEASRLQCLTALLLLFLFFSSRVLGTSEVPRREQEGHTETPGSSRAPNKVTRGLVIKSRTWSRRLAASLV